jgi:hypothetical protein
MLEHDGGAIAAELAVHEGGELLAGDVLSRRLGGDVLSRRLAVDVLNRRR